MAKTITKDQKVSSQDDVLKKRKKDAKKEAKMMLQVEQAKKDVQRVERKIQKAQDTLKVHTDRLHELEGALKQLQVSTPAPIADDAPKAKNKNKSATESKNKPTAEAKGESKADAKSDKKKKKKSATEEAPAYEGQPLDPGDSYQNSANVEALHLSSPEPAEGRTDLSDNTISASEISTQKDVQAVWSEQSATNDTASAEKSTTSTPIEAIPTAQPAASNTAEIHGNLSISPAPDEVKITSNQSSMPIETSDVHAWPPPAVREELAESVTTEPTNGETASKSSTDTDADKTDADKAEAHDGEDSGTHRTPRHRNTRIAAAHKHDQQNGNGSQEHAPASEEQSSDKA
ncbi:hypothetical protein KDA_24460 [Dictyobacter alpinus]|uniref:Uncharacterized protein n=1 Tax=Dictyobacter alpinus TaxID=2014873 RepID=A0A402B6J5_9CHLR|nr:hypothetical protein [Dictyobacter alpinus]GCE26962.1 hypothetical protein KDA_24460 [Dictyobacter alpinus]